jgi:AraC-like DNA-binding protein
MAVTVTNLRRFAGSRWSPPVLSLGFRSREPIPAVDLFEGSRVVVQPGQTYIEFPRTMLGLQARPAVPPGLRDPSADVEALPGGLEGLVKLQIDSWLPDGIPSIDLVAETLWTSRRSLQRRLADRGTSYTDLLDAVRLERAVDWLERTDRPVVEISHDLGYADPANFTRAFRRWTGVPPDRFRRSTRSGEDGGR